MRTASERRTLLFWHTAPGCHYDRQGKALPTIVVSTEFPDWSLGNIGCGLRRIHFRKAERGCRHLLRRDTRCATLVYSQ